MSVINTNYLALVSQNNLTKAQNSLGTAIERLSSGLRINSAKDDAAGQAIANRFTSNIKGLTQASRNANDGISIAQTTEGSLNEINTNLQRIRELTVQAANGSNSTSDLDSIQAEIDQRLDEIDRVSRESQFNGRTILGKNAETLTVQVGANDGQTISIGLRTIDRDSLKLDGFNVNGAGSTPNKVATTDSLTLAGATNVGKVGTAEQYQIETDNKTANTADVLAFAQDGDTVAVGGTTYTYNAAANNYTHGGAVTDGEGIDAIADAMTPELGSATKATVTIGGASTEITITSDGNITATASGKALYLDVTGNLTETKAGSISQATVSTLSESLASLTGSSIAIDGGATYTTQAGYAGLTDSRGVALVDTTTLAGQITATATNTVELDVTLNGNTTSIKIDENGDVFAADGTTALYLGTDGNLTADVTGAQLDAEALAQAVAARSGSIEVTDGSNAVDNTVDGQTFGGNGRAVNASGLTISAAALADVVRQNNGVTTVTLNVGDAAAEQAIDITSNGTVVSSIAFNGGGGTDAIAGGTVHLDAGDRTLTDDTTTNVNYWVQENGNVTNDSGQRIYEDGNGGFTTDEATIGGRSENPLDRLDNALSEVDKLRSELGAVQNRFQSTIANLANTVNNLSAARSRIEDADYAVEVSNMTRAQILQQAGTSVLAQANQVPQSVLSLLR